MIDGVSGASNCGEHGADQLLPSAWNTAPYVAYCAYMKLRLSLRGQYSRTDKQASVAVCVCTFQSNFLTNWQIFNKVALLSEPSHFGSVLAASIIRAMSKPLAQQPRRQTSLRFLCAVNYYWIQWDTEIYIHTHTYMYYYTCTHAYRRMPQRRHFHFISMLWTSAHGWWIMYPFVKIGRWIRFIDSEWIAYYDHKGGLLLN
jgi:hypothetical protein